MSNMSAEVDANVTAAGPAANKAGVCNHPEPSTSVEGRVDERDVRERLRNDGLNTVSKLLHESRAENRILKDKNSQLERTVDSLNTKLQKSGGTNTSGPSGGGEPKTSTSHQYDEEAMLPASSRQLVENLIRENSRLKHHIHNPQKIDELNLRACSLQSLNNSLKQERGKLSQELEDLKESIKRSDKDKDKHIMQLIDELKDCRSDYQREQSHRLTLEAEISKLNDELTDTAQKCLNMRKHLPTSTAHTNPERGGSLSQPSSLTVSTSMQQQRPQVFSEQSLHDQNSRLEARCHHLEQQLQSLQHLQSIPGLEQLAVENRLLKERLRERDEEIVALKERCALMAHQLQAYKEDFNKERREREVARRKYAEMEQRYKEMTSQIPVKGNPGNNAWDGRQQAASRPQRTGQHAVRFTSQLSNKQTSKDNQPKPSSKRERSTSSSKVVEDNVSLSSQTDVVRPSLHPAQTSQLACYKCNKRFTMDQHSLLVDHLDVCEAVP